ncbi:MAG: sodium:solute symporter family protein [Planctomycetia bacterium]|nr:sodium:solute symporter family protein [Planctomycetia bacterium]
MSQFDSLDWGGLAAVGAMYAAFLVVGARAARRVQGGPVAGLILAGRDLPLWVATLTMTATWVDGGYLLGTAEGVFKPRGGLLLGLQGGICFGVSLILGGLFFARTMRAREFTTLVDPFEARFGKRWAAVLAAPALLGEAIWSAALLAAIAATFGVLLRMDRTTAVLLSSAVVTTYTMLGGMWSVAWTDIFQLALVPVGLLAALPFAMGAAGGWDVCLREYFAMRSAEPAWSFQQTVGWWDVTAMLVLGGIPWNCYFQRVLSCRSPVVAQRHSILAGLLTILLTVPPLLLGMAAAGQRWPAFVQAALADDPSSALPMLLRHAVPYGIGLLGLAAIVGAVTSSFSSSILSAASMFGWNIYGQLIAPRARPARVTAVVRGSIVLLGAGAAAFALLVQSVQELWFFTADLVFVLLVPQLFAALYDPQANRIGSITAFAVSLVLRLGGGLPLLGLEPFIPYPELCAAVVPISPGEWYELSPGGVQAMLFPYKTTAFLAGVLLLPCVSRLTGRWDPPRPLSGK